VGGNIVLQSDGRIIIGGSFTAFNDVPVDGIARLEADGRSTELCSGRRWRNRSGHSPANDSRLLLYGQFSSIGGAPDTSAMGRINADDGTIDPAFAVFGNVRIAIGPQPPGIFLDDGSVLMGSSYATAAGAEYIGLVHFIPAIGPTITMQPASPTETVGGTARSPSQSKAPSR